MILRCIKFAGDVYAYWMIWEGQVDQRDHIGAKLRKKGCNIRFRCAPEHDWGTCDRYWRDSHLLLLLLLLLILNILFFRSVIIELLPTPVVCSWRLWNHLDSHTRNVASLTNFIRVTGLHRVDIQKIISGIWHGYLQFQSSSQITKMNLH